MQIAERRSLSEGSMERLALPGDGGDPQLGVDRRGFHHVRGHGTLACGLSVVATSARKIPRSSITVKRAYW